MAGTLVITTLSDGTNSTSATNPIRGSAKAWAFFNGTTATIQKAFNISSVTKAAAGQYTVNFTSALPDALYSAVGAASYPQGFQEYGGTRTTTAFAFYTPRTTNGAPTDCDQVSVVFND